MNLGMPEMIFIFLIALLVLGPRKLPEIAKQMGKAVNEFKKASNDFKAQLESEISAVNLEEERQKMRDLAGTILPPERTVPMTPEPTPATIHATGQQEASAHPEAPASSSVNKEPNA